MTAALQRLEQDLADRLETDCGTAPDAGTIGAWVLARFDAIGNLVQWQGDFETRYQAALDAQEQGRAILELARLLGASSRQLVDDERALGLFFGRDAVLERVRRRMGHEERAVVYGLDRLGELGQDCLANAHARAAIERAWAYTRDPRLREAGFRSIRLALERAEHATTPEQMLWEVQRAALDRRGPTWVQTEALTILALASPESANVVAKRRFSEPEPGDDLFVRRHLVRLIASGVAFSSDRLTLLREIVTDQSPAVRQCLAEVLHSCGEEAITDLAARLASDNDARVKAMLALHCPKLPRVGGDILVRLLDQEEDGFVLRTALHAVTSWAFASDRDGALVLMEKFEPAIFGLLARHSERKVRAWAAAAAEQLWCAAHAEARPLFEQLCIAIAPVEEGRTVMVPGLSEQAERQPVLVGRVLAVLAQDDLGLELLPGGRLRRGDLMAFRSWRLLHEWRHPTSDKRQAFRHWIGRVWRGRLIAPSVIMAELAPTKVPGEPLFQPDEGSWRPWLPLPDMVLSAIDTGETVRIVTADGVTEIDPPARFRDRLAARFRLTWRFRDLAALRNWTEASGSPAISYAEAIRKLGVGLKMTPHEGRALDPQPARFFSIAPAALLGIPELWEQASTYFSSLYANSLLHLGLFLGLAAGWFFLNHWLRNRAMRRARSALPVVVGGWGTRGKSGTERLKAAVFSALGHPLISKTTGNEAMFLHSLPMGEVREMFLFRPYDKATIWEQLDLAVLAHELHARVFLWECMGLTPSYVKVLQRHWMRDDIGTITNTYPDHEDVQGPAGRNIPEVMTNFIPPGTSLITSEEQMRPILAQACRDLGTSFSSVGWLEAGMIPDEFLNRFPYEEHPFNIALVTAMCAEIGIAPDVAVKEMADRVVQDIGALKVYPEAPVQGRRLEFVLGNSANERFGALGNWTRLGFDRHDPVAEPDLWITTVINNRADRVPRSRVFASILAKDISADRHVLIGSNLEGLQGFIAEAWAEQAPSLTLSPPDRPDAEPLSELEAIAKRFRIVHREEQLAAILAIMNQSAAAKPDDCAAEHAERCATQLRTYQAFEQEVKERGTSPDLDVRLRDQLWLWFREKIVVVEDYHATGEEIVRRLVSITPPGIRNRIMGMQNIKGTGLDFVYRWHAWEAVHRACEDGLSGDPGRIDRALATLSSFREYGVLAKETVEATIAHLRGASSLEGEVAQNQLDLIATQLSGQLQALDKSAPGGGQARGGKWIERLEAFLDAGDAVRRRKKADLIYGELAAERISSDQAVSELKALTSRQKGGWLKKDLARRRS